MTESPHPVMLSGWGNYPTGQTRLVSPQNRDQLLQITTGNTPCIARGMGRSYGDPAVSPGLTISMLRFNAFLAFDESKGELICESGVTLDDIIQTLLPRGWFPLVTPGTRHVSVGGAIAADVHGKNHHGVGSFASSVIAFDLLTAAGNIVTCSRSSHNSLFFATLGGMGQTGVILTATLQMQPVESDQITERTLPCKDLDTLFKAIEANANWAYSVAWVDCLATEPGKSILILGKHASGKNSLAENNPGKNSPAKTIPGKTIPGKNSPGSTRSRKRHAAPALSLPFYLPEFVLNRFSIKLLAGAYLATRQPGERKIGINQYFYPLDGIQNWNRAYGRRGFLQFQCALPRDTSYQTLIDIFETTRKFGLPSFLSVLKQFGKGGSFLSFPTEGMTLALDFPNTLQSRHLIQQLHELVLSANGRLYLAKDALMQTQEFEQGYGENLAAFRQQKLNIDPDQKFVSLQSERLGITT